LPSLFLFAGGLRKSVLDFENRYARQHGNRKDQWLATACCEQRQSRTGTISGETPANTECQSAKNQSPVNLPGSWQPYWPAQNCLWTRRGKTECQYADQNRATHDKS